MKDAAQLWATSIHIYLTCNQVQKAYEQIAIRTQYVVVKRSTLQVLNHHFKVTFSGYMVEQVQAN